MDTLYLASVMVFCKPTILTPLTIVWFPAKLCLIISIQAFIGRISKLNNRYWLETLHFFENNNSNVPLSF